MTETELITNYFEIQIMMGHIGVIWFGTSITLCGLILKYTIDYKVSSKTSPFGLEIAGLIGGYLVALVAYGLFSVYYLRQVSEGIIGLMPLTLMKKGNVAAVTECITYFYMFPTFTFFLIAIAWGWILRRKLE